MRRGTHLPLVLGIALALTLAGAALSGVLFFGPSAADAQLTIDSSVGTTLGLASTNLVEVAIRIIQWVLAVVTLVALGFVIYGGFLWMTAAGNEERIKRAKKVIINATIGLAIITLAWAIVFFVSGTIENAAGPGGEGPGEEPCVGPGCIGTPDFSVVWVDPADGEFGVALCRLIQAGFSDTLDPDTVNETTVLITQVETGDSVPGTFTARAPDGTPLNVFKFDPAGDYEPNADYRVQITSGVQSEGHTGVRPREWTFSTGTESDDIPPTVDAAHLTPKHGDADVCLATPIEAPFSEPMDVTTLNLDNIAIDPAVALGSLFIPNPQTMTVRPTSLLAEFTTYNDTLNGDIPTGIADSCGNPLDGNADGTGGDDFGGASQWQYTTGSTAECTPEIFDIEPEPGYYNDTLTITGRHFFSTPSNVVFSQGVWADDSCFNETTFLPSAACLVDWQSDRITVKTPGSGGSSWGAVDGPVQVAVGSDLSNPVTIDVGSPHISWISPGSGGAGQWVTVSGVHFGAAPGQVRFIRERDGLVIPGGQTPCEGGWSEGTVLTTVPADFDVGDDLLLQVQTATAPGDGAASAYSNPIPFRVTDQVGPGLCAVAPTCGLQGDPVTLSGERFGTTGTVYFDEHPASASDWGDTEIAATVPDIENDQYRVIVTTEAGPSNGLPFDLPCGDVPVVVDDGSCNDTTLASPSPRPDAGSVCLEAGIHARFSHPMNPGTIIDPDNVFFAGCGSDASFSEEDCGANLPGDIDAIGSPEDAFLLSPTNPLAVDTWYQVTVKRFVLDTDGRQMPRDYRWHFKTQAEDTVCAIDHVTVVPPTDTETASDVAVGYTALPVGPACTVLNPADYPWTWSSSVPAVALVAASVPGSAVATTSEREGTTAITAETGLDRGSGTLTLDLGGPPAVVNRACSARELGSVSPRDGRTDVCLNAMVSATFDRDMADATLINGANHELVQCNTGGPYNPVACTLEVPDGPLSVVALGGEEAFQFTPGETLIPDTWYRYTVGTGVTSERGVALPAPAVWAFKTQAGSDECPLRSAIVSPGWATIHIADEQVYTATGIGETCDDLLDDDDRIWSWISSDEAVATLRGSSTETETATALETGTTTVSASSGGESGAGSLYVAPGVGPGGECSSSAPPACTPDADRCAPGLVCDSSSCTCRTPGTPTITDHQPQGDEVWVNAAATATFDQPMNGGTITTASFVLQPCSEEGDRDCVGGTWEAPIATSVIYSAWDRRAILYPAALLDADRGYRATVTDEVTSSDGGRLAADFVWTFKTNETGAVAPTTRVELNPPFVSMTVRDATALFTAAAFAEDGTPLAAEFSWSFPWQDPIDTVSFEAPPGDGSTATVKADNLNGQAHVEARVDTASARSSIQVRLCETPWEYTDDATNFNLYYCQDGGLPALDRVVVAPPTPDLIKEFFFSSSARPDDVIGVRVVANPEHYSPQRWYAATFPGEGGGLGPMTVDGYQGVRVGRTIYVAGTNVVGGTTYTNVYLISYNDGASSEMQSIYNALLADWTINWNIGDASQKARIVRDTERVADLGDIAWQLDTYRASHGLFPALPGGSYLAGMSTSVWPSWQATLGNELGTSVPSDPINSIVCPSCVAAESFTSGRTYFGIEAAGGAVFATDNAARKVVRCDAELLTCTDLFTGLTSPTGLANDKSDPRELLVADAGRLLRIDAASGVLLDEITGLGTSIKDVATDQGGNVFITTDGPQRVLKYDRTLTTELARWIVPSDAAWGVDTDTAGNVYLALYGMNAIVKLSNDLTSELGRFVCTTGDCESTTFQPIGLDVDSDGRVVVVEWDGARAFILESVESGAKVASFGQFGVSGSDDQHLNHPYQVVSTGDGYLVTDRGNSRVVQLSAELASDRCRTCWDDSAHTFSCPASSHIYLYRSPDAGETSQLWAGLEEVDDWFETGGAENPCTDAPGSSCQCFNTLYSAIP